MVIGLVKRRWRFALLVGCLLGAATSSRGAEHHVVAIDGAAFVPAAITVRLGDRVTWTNKDPYPHTVTGEQFDSRTIATGASWTYHAAQKGTFPYICALHPTMKGTLIVN
jgi:plastocyanin